MVWVNKYGVFKYGAEIKPILPRSQKIVEACSKCHLVLMATHSVKEAIFSAIRDKILNC